MTIQQAKEMDTVDYLSGIGHVPAKISHYSYWYFSPLREEKTPTFKVNDQRTAGMILRAKEVAGRLQNTLSPLHCK
jgi:hypothetical protein